MMMMMWKKQRFPMGMIFLAIIFAILGLILIGASQNSYTMGGITIAKTNGFAFLANANVTVGWALIQPTNTGVSATLQAGIVFAVILAPVLFLHAFVLGATAWGMMPMGCMKGMKGKNMKMMD